MSEPETTVGRIAFGQTNMLPQVSIITATEATQHKTTIAPRGSVYTYTPDPEEEAWHASPEGLRASARSLRQSAADMLRRADALEAEARQKEAGK